jgi:hypothetical protein
LRNTTSESATTVSVVALNDDFFKTAPSTHSKGPGTAPLTPLSFIVGTLFAETFHPT